MIIRRSQNRRRLKAQVSNNIKYFSGKASSSLVALFFLGTVVVLLIPRGGVSHEPVTTNLRFNKQIIRIFRKHCLACHQPGNPSKVVLSDFASARPWAKAFKEEVLERRMPPFQAVKGFGSFQSDYALTQHELDQIVAWVEGGAPKGDDKDLPSTEPISLDSYFAKPPVSGRVLPFTSSVKNTDVVKVQHTLTRAADAVAIRPLLFPFAKSVQATAYFPNGSSQVLIWAKDYKHDWQPPYEFKAPISLPGGTRIEVVAHLNKAIEDAPVRLCELALAETKKRGTGYAPLKQLTGDEVYYVCPMHPDVMAETPGRCPKCGMTMVRTGPPETREYDVQIKTEPAVLKPREKFLLTFDIINPQSGVRVKDFNIYHDMPFHLFLVSQDLTYFEHLHPQQQTDGRFAIDTSLPRAGAYMIYCDMFPVGGLPHVVQRSLVTAGFNVDLFGQQAKLEPDHVWSKSVSGMRVELTLNPIEPVGGKNVTLKYRLIDAVSGEPVTDLQPYLGAWGHTLILSEDGRDYIHSHPSELIPDGADRNQLHGGPNVLFDAFLPRAGRYRIWSQFQRNGEVVTLSFTIAARGY